MRIRGIQVHRLIQIQVKDDHSPGRACSASMNIVFSHIDVKIQVNWWAEMKCDKS